MIYIATIFILSGLVIRIIAIKQLKGNFTARLEKPKNLIITGLYKYIRHPCYTGSLLILVGITLLSVEIAILYLSFVFFHSRIITEEQILSKSYFKGYSDYKKKTGMFFPKFITRKKDNN